MNLGAWRHSRRLWLVLFLGTLVLAHAPLLRIATTALTVQDALPQKASAVLVSSGDDRYRIAADWVQRGTVSKILLPTPLPGRNVAMGIIPSDDVLSRKHLHAIGIPDSAFEHLENVGFRGDWRDIRLLGCWLIEHPNATVIVLCGQLESRRTRYLLDRLLSKGDASRVYVHGIPSRTFEEHRWWSSRAGARQVFSSLLGSAYDRSVGEDRQEPITWDIDAYERGLTP